MRINTKIRYGLRTMVELATAKTECGMLQKEIAENQQISLKYLDSIISALKVKGLVKNCKGKGSGYRLSRPAGEITMFDIYTAFEQVIVVECVTDFGFCEKATKGCKARNFWCELGNDFIDLLRSRTLDQVVTTMYGDKL